MRMRMRREKDEDEDEDEDEKGIRRGQNKQGKEYREKEV